MYMIIRVHFLSVTTACDVIYPQSGNLRLIALVNFSQTSQDRYGLLGQTLLKANLDKRVFTLKFNILAYISRVSDKYILV